MSPKVKGQDNNMTSMFKNAVSSHKSIQTYQLWTIVCYKDLWGERTKLRSKGYSVHGHIQEKLVSWGQTGNEWSYVDTKLLFVKCSTFLKCSNINSHVWIKAKMQFWANNLKLKHNIIGCSVGSCMTLNLLSQTASGNIPLMLLCRV